MYLRCAAGSVEWVYPTGALIVNVRPNTFPPPRLQTLCIKPLKGSSGANIYLEKTGELKLLVRDGDRGPGRVSCFGFEHGGLFVEAAPQQDISRRTTGFQYELTGRPAGSDLQALSGGWRALAVGWEGLRDSLGAPADGPRGGGVLGARCPLGSQGPRLSRGRGWVRPRSRLPAVLGFCAVGAVTGKGALASLLAYGLAACF